MSIRAARLKTGLITSPSQTYDDERRPGALVISGAWPTAALLVTAPAAIERDGAGGVTLPANTAATLGDSTATIDVSTHGYVTYLDADGNFKACRQEHLQTVATAGDVWPLHYIMAPDIKRYQIRTVAAPAPPVVVLLAGSQEILGRERGD